MLDNETRQLTDEDLQEEPGFWDTFDYETVSARFFVRVLWFFFLRLIFRFYCRVKKKGSFRGFYKKYPRLIIISNHTSHLDAGVICSAIPFSHWKNLHVLVAKDYWYSTWYLRLFSKYCLKAIPVDRKSKKEGSLSIKKCLDILTESKRKWLVMFPEGTRSADGSLKPFKKGVNLLSKKSHTPILFLYMHGNQILWPKRNNIPRPGNISLHIGPVIEASDSDDLFEKYQSWLKQLESEVK